MERNSIPDVSLDCSNLAFVKGFSLSCLPVDDLLHDLGAEVALLLCWRKIAAGMLCRPILTIIDDRIFESRVYFLQLLA